MKQKYNEKSEHDPWHRLTSSSQNDRMIFFCLKGALLWRTLVGEAMWVEMLFFSPKGVGVGWRHAIIHDDKLSTEFFLSPFRHVSTTINCSLSLFDLAPPPPPYTFIPLFISEKLIWPQKLLEVSSDSPAVFQGGWCLGGHPRFRSLHPSQRKSACS